MQQGAEGNNELQIFMFIRNANPVVLINSFKSHQGDNFCDLEDVMMLTAHFVRQKSTISVLQ